jgi:hypothetical protein
MRKLLALLFLFGVAAFAQAPNIIQSPHCPGGGGSLFCVDTVGSTPSSIRMFIKFDVATDRVQMQCGVPGWVQPAVQHELFVTDNDAEGRYISVTGLAPSTAFECRAGAAATADATHTYTWSSRLTYTTPARPADAWDVPADPVQVVSAYPTITGSTLNATCATLQAQINAAAALSQSLTHEVVIPAGSHCVGNFTVSNHKTGPGYLVIRSSAVGTTNFPPEGVRIDPARYANQFAWIEMPAKTSGYQNGLVEGDAGIYISDGSSYIRIVGIATQPQPTVNNWVYRDGTCTFNSGSDVSVNVAASGGQPSFLLDGRTVKVLTASTLPGLVGNTYPMTAVGAFSSSTTFTLNGTNAVSGSTGSCRVAVMADATLTSCTAGTAGVTRCTTNVAHGLVTDTVVKVIGDLSAGFNPRTQYVDVIDPTTLEFRGSTFTGSYTANSARVVMDGSVYVYGVSIFRSSPTVNVSSNIILDRVYIHHPGPPYKSGYGVRLGCDYCGLVESYVDPNGQWTFTVPGTVTEQRSFGYITSGYNVNSDLANEGLLMRNNYVGFHVLGIAGGSNNPTGYAPPHWATVVRNTIEFPESFRSDLTNTKWDGLTYNFNRQGLEWKSQRDNVYRGNRFFSNANGQDIGSPWIVSSRADKQITDWNQNLVFEYNTTASGANGPAFGGMNTGNSPRATPQGQRYFVRHNIFIVDGMRTQMGNSGQGHCMTITPVENFVYEHNLCINRGSYQSTIFGGGSGSGWKIRNNVFTYNKGPQPLIWKYQNTSAVTLVREWEYPDGVITYPTDAWGSWRNMVNAIGQASPPVINGTTYPVLDPTSEFRNNAFIAGVEGSSATCDASNTAACNASKSECEADLGALLTAYGGNLCWDAGQSIGTANVDTFIKRLTAAGFTAFDRTVRYGPGDAASRTYNLRLRHGSPFKSGATTASNAQCANALCMRAGDGTDLGPDMIALEAAQGLVHNARVIATTTTTATIGYYAPDAAACYVDYWTGSNTPTRVSDGGGSRVRNVTLNSLTTVTPYSYIVQCAVEQPTGAFTTK